MHKLSIRKEDYIKTKLALAFLLLTTLACDLPNPAPPTATETSSTPLKTTTRINPTPLPATPTQLPDTPIPPILPFPIVGAPEFTAFHMLDELDGWAITEGSILRTHDGGATWYDVNLSGVSYLGYGTAFSFLDDEQAWVLLPNLQEPINTGVLYHTHDGGLNWEAMPAPFGNGNLEILDQNQGWMMVNLGVAVGSMGVSIFQTKDGGLTWQQTYTNDPNAPNASNSLPLSGLKNNLVAINAQKAWVAGVIYAPNTIYLYKTADSGKTWELQNLPMAPDTEKSEASTTGPILLSANEVILPVHFMGETLQTGLYSSQNGGETWEFINLLPGLGSVDFITPSKGFYWSGEQLFDSEDGGQTWIQVPSNTDFGDHLVFIDFVSAQTGWVVTSEDERMVLYKTVDGGKNWTRLTP